MANKKQTIGIALSGGGIRGFAHLGALKALEEANVTPNLIAGTSAGALIGAYYASGLKANDIYELLHAKDVFSLSEITIPKKGLLNFKRLEREMRETLPQTNFETLPIPLIIAVSNLNKGCVEYISQGDVVKAAVASASIPTLFTPVQIGTDEYCDGGVFNNMPVNQLVNKCDIIIGVNISPVKPINHLGSMADIAARAFQLSVNATSIDHLNKCDIYIEPQGIREYDLLDTKHIKEIYDAGYSATKTALENKLTQLLNPPSFFQKLVQQFTGN